MRLEELVKRLKELYPDEAWDTLEHSDGNGRRFTSVQCFGPNIIVMLNSLGEFRVIGDDYAKVTRDLCGVDKPFVIFKEAWYM